MCVCVGVCVRASVCVCARASVCVRVSVCVLRVFVCVCVRVSDAAKDFSPRMNFQCRLSYGVRTAWTRYREKSIELGRFRLDSSNVYGDSDIIDHTRPYQIRMCTD